MHRKEGRLSASHRTADLPCDRRTHERDGRILSEYEGHAVSHKNDFFGESITVTGLLTGRDIIEQLKGKELGDRLYLPENLLRMNTRGIP